MGGATGVGGVMGVEDSDGGGTCGSVVNDKCTDRRKIA